MSALSLRASIGRWLIPALFVFSLAMLALGLTAPYVMANFWLPRPQMQVLVILFIAVAMNGLFYGLSRFGRRALFLGAILMTSAGILAFAFGWQSAGAALLTLLSCFCTGQLFFHITRCLHASLLDILAVGIGVTILLLTACGVAQIDMPTVYITLLIAPAALVLFVPTIRQRLTNGFPQIGMSPTLQGFSYIRFILGTVLLAAILYYVAASSLPEVSWDGLVMHLLVPTQILMHGHWAFDQTLYAFAPWPLGTDYLFGMAMLAGGELAAKCFNLLLFCVLMAQLFDLVQRRYGRDAALASVTLLITMPLAIVVTSALYVENMLAILTLAGLRLLDASEETDPKTTLIGMTVMMGALAAVKMHGLFLDAFFLIALCAMPFWKKITWRAWSAVVVVAALAAGLGLLTYLYAWMKTGNPIFMFKNSFFHSPFWAQEDWLDKRWMDKLSWRLLYRMTFESQNYIEALPGTIGFAFVTFLLPGVAALFTGFSRHNRGLVIVTLGFIAFMLSQTQYIRYLYAVMPALLVFCVAGFEQVQQMPFLRKFPRCSLYGFVIIVALLGFYKFPAGDWILRFTDFSQVGNPAGRLRDISIAAPERLANDMINSAGMSDPRVLYGTLPFGGNLHGTPLYTDWYNYTLHKDLEEATSDEQIAAIIADRHVDFLIANDVSEEPIYKKLAFFAHGHFTPYGHLGRLTIYSLR